MNQAIEVEDKNLELPRPGKTIALALIGQGMDMFEIRKTERGYDFYINDDQVTPDVYRLALDTADRDRYCEGCMGSGVDDVHEHS